MVGRPYFFSMYNGMNWLINILRASNHNYNHDDNKHKTQCNHPNVTPSLPLVRCGTLHCRVICNRLLKDDLQHKPPHEPQREQLRLFQCKKRTNTSTHFHTHLLKPSPQYLAWDDIQRMPELLRNEDATPLSQDWWWRRLHVTLRLRVYNTIVQSQIMTSSPHNIHAHAHTVSSVCVPVCDFSTGTPMLPRNIAVAAVRINYGTHINQPTLKQSLQEEYKQVDISRVSHTLFCCSTSVNCLARSASSECNASSCSVDSLQPLNIHDTLIILLHNITYNDIQHVRVSGSVMAKLVTVQPSVHLIRKALIQLVHLRLPHINLQHSPNFIQKP